MTNRAKGNKKERCPCKPPPGAEGVPDAAPALPAPSMLGKRKSTLTVRYTQSDADAAAMDDLRAKKEARRASSSAALRAIGILQDDEALCGACAMMRAPLLCFANAPLLYFADTQVLADQAARGNCPCSTSTLKA